MSRRQILVYRDGRVYVHAERCATCIFRPGNLMRLQPGRVAQLTTDALRRESVIPCHETMDGATPAVCRGFYELHRSTPLQIAERLGVLTLQDVPPVRELPATEQGR